MLPELQILFGLPARNSEIPVNIFLNSYFSAQTFTISELFEYSVNQMPY